MSILRHSLKVGLILITIISFQHISIAQSWVDAMNNPNADFYKTQKLANDYFKDKTYEKGKGWKPFKRWEYFMKTRVDSNGHFTHQLEAFKAYNKVQQQYATARLGQGTAGNWTSMGPNGAPQGTGAGRLNCIAFHPTNSNYILAGAASGGIWVSTNNGASWKTYSDNLGTLGISSIAFAPSDPNTVYAATGDGDAKDTYTIGVIKSTDGGKHWSLTGLTQPIYANRLVYKILVHPTDKNTVYATTSLGIYKTTDGGATWTKKRAGVYRDMEFKPGSPNTLYFATKTFIMKTTNGGSSFSKLSLSLSTSTNRLELAVTPADANYLYVLASKTSDDGFAGIYRSTNSGTSFTTMATTPNILGWKWNGSDAGGQGWYDLAIAVSRTNKNTIFTGGVNIWKSTNGGSTWTLNTHWQGTGAPYVHSDIHGLEFSPHNSSTLWACTDGGAYTSTNTGSTWSAKNSGLQIGQIYRLGASATNANKIMTGWQDNGSSLMTNSWNKVMGGDGMECIIDYNNNNIMYGSIYYGDIYRTANGGTSWTPITNGINEKGDWVTPYVMDGNNPNILFAGYVNVYRSTNKGSSWTKISNLPSSNQPITALAVAPSNAQVIYISAPQSFKKTTDGGQTWTNMTSVGGNVTSFAVHPNNPNTLWVTIGGYSFNKKVMKSINGGQSWINLTDTLPNIPINCIVYEKNTANGIYIGTDMGVYYRDDNLNRWVPFMKNLPNVIVNELEIFYPGNKIRAATYGRALWESDTYALANSIAEKDKEQNQLKVFPNPANNEISIDMSGLVSQNTQIRIINSMGAIVKTENMQNSSVLNISVSGLSNGIYFIELQTDNSLYFGKFIKK